MNKVTFYSNDDKLSQNAMVLNQNVDDVPNAVSGFISDGLFLLFVGVEITYPAVLAIADKAYADLDYKTIADDVTQIDVKSSALFKYAERMDAYREAKKKCKTAGLSSKLVASRYFEGRSERKLDEIKEVLDTNYNDIEDREVRIERHLYDTVHDIYRSSADEE